MAHGGPDGRDPIVDVAARPRHGSRMQPVTLQDDEGSFEVTVRAVEGAARAVLVAVGGGGDPERHAPLLDALAARGFAVAAPRFERMTAPHPTEPMLLLRARRLSLALDLVAPPGVPAVGVGHSIGAATLLALAGGNLWLAPTRPLPIAKDDRLARLALLAPATGFFRGPGGLDAVTTPIALWAGALDAMTPPAHAEFVREAVGDRAPVEVRVVDGAGHFTFMDAPPPHVVDPMPAREEFLADLARAIGDFAAG
jgi:alpha-beta hydrolase superfamily lysophospholipase